MVGSEQQAKVGFVIWLGRHHRQPRPFPGWPRRVHRNPVWVAVLAPWWILPPPATSAHQHAG